MKAKRLYNLVYTDTEKQARVVIRCLMKLTLILRIIFNSPKTRELNVEIEN